MSDEIVWENPPKTSGSGARNVWADRLAPLRERPGEWARVMSWPAKDKAGATANNLKSGRVRGGDGYEFTTRRSADGSALYARYIGKPVKAVS